MEESGKEQRLSGLEITESEILLSHEWLKKIASINLIQTPAIEARREVYEKLGGFDFRLAGTEDWEMCSNSKFKT